MDCNVSLLKAWKASNQTIAVYCILFKENVFFHRLYISIDMTRENRKKEINNDTKS